MIPGPVTARILVELADWALRTILMALSAAALLYILRIRSARGRHIVWSAVLFSMLLLPLCLEWGPVLRLRILPEAKTSQQLVQLLTAPSSSSFPFVSSHGAKTAGAPLISLFWLCAVGAVYFIGASLLLAQLVVGTVFARRLMRTRISAGSHSVSPNCASPLTVGWLHPIVLLPADWREWPERKLTAVLSHEAEHVRWRDPLVRWLALLNRALFWFHPLAWWLERNLSSLAEEACDQAALARGTDPREYASWLLQFARSVKQAGAQVQMAAMGMPGESLPSRLRRLKSHGLPGVTSKVRMIAAGLACMALSTVIATGAPERYSSGRAARAVPGQHSVGVADTAPPSSLSSPRVGAIYIDLASISRPDVERALASVQNVIPAAMPEGMRAALMVNRGGAIETAQAFTSDGEELRKAVQKLTYLEDSKMPDAGENDSLAGLRTVAEDLRSQAGGKNIYWVMGHVGVASATRYQQMHEALETLEKDGVHVFMVTPGI
jgi:beta-lactamase regulating signal transducer with metallopeptidase domain